MKTKLTTEADVLALPFDEAKRLIEEVYEAKYDPNSDLSVYDQLLACISIDEATPIKPSDKPIDPLEEMEIPEKGGENKNMPQVINDYGSYEVPKGESNYLKLEDGDNRLRLVSKPMELKLHENKTGTKFSTSLCQGENCELCAKGVKIKYKYAYIVLSRKDNKAYVYEAPITVFRQIVAFATDPEYGDPEGYDLTIKMSGQKPNIVYQVIASPKKAKLTADEEEIIAQAHLNLEENYANKANS